MIYFDNAATSFPKPPSVIEEVTKAISEYGGNPGRSGHRLSLMAGEKIYEARENLASLLSLPSPENIVFTMNATYAINTALHAEGLEGGHVFISNREHNAVYRPIARLADEGKITFSVYDSKKSPEEALPSPLPKNTRLLILNHVSNVTGEALDAARYADFCRKNGIPLMLDASQSLGHLPFSGEEIKADIICAPGHKGLFGIQGAGFVYFRDPRLRRTFITGGSGSRSLEREMPPFLPDRYEAGTLPTPAIAGLSAGTRFLLNIGVSEIARKTAALRRRAVEMLSSFPSVSVLAPEDGHAVLSFTHRDIPPDEIAEELDRCHICVRAGYHCAPLAHATAGTLSSGSVRLSFSVFNKPEELELLYRTLKEIL